MIMTKNKDKVIKGSSNNLIENQREAKVMIPKALLASKHSMIMGNLLQIKVSNQDNNKVLNKTILNLVCRRKQCKFNKGKNKLKLAHKQPEGKKIDKRLMWIMEEQERNDAQRSKGLIKGVIGKQLVGQDGQHCW